MRHRCQLSRPRGHFITKSASVRYGHPQLGADRQHGKLPLLIALAAHARRKIDGRSEG